MVLVDTSVWIEVFRKGSAIDLQQIVPMEDVVTCLPIVQEVLQGFRDERAYRIARAAMAAMPIVDSPLPRERFDEAVELYRSCRKKGLTIRSGVDCLIAASAIRHALPILHIDRDYDQIARVSMLEARRAR